MLTEKAKQMIADWPLGFVATADGDGTPNLSPKGTFRVLDDKTIGFAEMRSPNTVRNIRERSTVAVNFIDILTRQGAAITGTATIAERGTSEYDGLVEHFVSVWGSDFEKMFNGVVLIEVKTCQDIDSPAYDVGATETGLRNDWMGKIADIYNRQSSAGEGA